MTDDVEVRYVTTDGEHYSIFTSSGTFYPPPGVTKFNVTVVGGGGAGGVAATADSVFNAICGAGAGGAGSGYVTGGSITIPDSEALYAEVGTGGATADRWSGGARGSESQLRYVSNGVAIYTAAGGYGGSSAQGDTYGALTPGNGGAGGSGGGGGGPMQNAGNNFQRNSFSYYESSGGAGGTNGGNGGVGVNYHCY